MQQVSQKVGYAELSKKCGVPTSRVQYHHKQLEKVLGQTIGVKGRGGRYEFTLSEQSMLLSRVQDCSKKVMQNTSTTQKGSVAKFSITKQRAAFNQRFDYYIKLLESLKKQANNSFDAMEGKYLTQVSELKTIAEELDKLSKNCEAWMEKSTYSLTNTEAPPRFPCVKNVVDLTIEEALEKKQI